MSIGLYDDDFMRYIHVCFNLELMKLATYYKKKKEVVVLAPEFDPYRYEKMYFRKDYNDYEFNKGIFKDNVQYGGFAFTPNYKPLSEDIERCKPDTEIYTRYRDMFDDTKEKTRLFDMMRRAQHIRLSLDEKNIWDKVEDSFEIKSQTQVLIFHDYNLNDIKDAHLFIKELVGRNKVKTVIGNKFPIQITDDKDLKKWQYFETSSNLFCLQLNNLVSDEFYVDLVLNLGRRCREIFYNVTAAASSENDFIENYLPKIFMQVLFSRNKKIKITLKYDDDFFIDKKWEYLIDLINLYEHSFDAEKRLILYEAMSDRTSTFTLYRYLKTPKFLGHLNKNRWWYDKQKIIDTFQMVREQNYEVFKMFYESCIVDFIGGKIVDV